MDVAHTSGSCFAGPAIPVNLEIKLLSPKDTEVKVYRYVALESTFLFAVELMESETYIRLHA